MGLCRWELIAGRIPGRTAEEVEIFWAKKAPGPMKMKTGYVQ